MKKLLLALLIVLLTFSFSACAENETESEQTYPYGTCVKCGKEGTQYMRTPGTKNIYYCDEHYHEIVDDLPTPAEIAEMVN